MEMNILVIGGGYFAGRVFLEELTAAGNYNVYALNRGNVSIRMDGVEVILCDRHDTEGIRSSVPELHWDAVVDFCGYVPEDILLLLDAVPGGSIGQYIFISTASVYASTPVLPIAEDGPLLAGPQPELGPTANYAYDKLRAEEVLRDRTAGTDTTYTLIRPAFIYGKYNYAPRESFFFDLLHEGAEIPLPENGLPLFSVVSVWDHARFVRRCCGNEAAYGRVFNASAPELISYPRIAEELKRLEPEKFRSRTVNRDEIARQGIPLPFPIDEHIVYDGRAAEEILKFEYTSFTAEFERTYSYYKIGKGWE